MKEIFERTKNIAVVGMSKNPDKSAYSIPAYLKSQGFNVIPVNPTTAEIDGVKCYASLAEVPEHIDMVNVFRPSQDAPEVMRQAVERHKSKGDISTVWLQLGIAHPEAKKLAEEAGLSYVEDKCIYIEHKYYLHDKNI